MTADEFERQYAASSGVTVEQLREMGREVRRCYCGKPECKGWQSVEREAISAEQLQELREVYPGPRVDFLPDF